MATFTKFNSFVEAVGRKIHNLNADVLKIMLTNVAPAAANAIKTDITEIAAGNGYTAAGTISASNTYTQTAGTAKLVSNDVVFTAVTGAMATFRYAVLYNSTATNGELIGSWDYGSAVTLAVGESFTVDLDQTNGVLTIV